MQNERRQAQSDQCSARADDRGFVVLQLCSRLSMRVKKEQ